MNNEYESIDKQEIKEIMWMWQSGVSIESITRWAGRSIQEVNEIIDEFLPAFQ
jgi:hypothetical protein